MWWRLALGVLLGLAVVWSALIVLLWHAQRRQPDRATLLDALRLVPDVVHLLRRLAGDRTLPRSLRIRLWLLVIYLISPIDLIPDFIPVLGYADDVIVVAIALRSITRRAGPDAIRQHWPGTPEGLSTVLRVTGLAAPLPDG